MMKLVCLLCLHAVVGSFAFSFQPPLVVNPVAKDDDPTSCETGSIRMDLAELKQKVEEILVILERIELKQSELASLTVSYEELDNKYDILLAAVTKLLSQECKADIDDSTCITSCGGKPDGNYQSCTDCSVYLTCTNGVLNSQQCPANSFGGKLVWDDVAKSCKDRSTTCLGFTGDSCIRDCTGKADGDYQSCYGCDIYLTCSNGLNFDFRSCADRNAQGDKLVWDDNKKRCEYETETCVEQ